MKQFIKILNLSPPLSLFLYNIPLFNFFVHVYQFIRLFILIDSSLADSLLPPCFPVLYVDPKVSQFCVVNFTCVHTHAHNDLVIYHPPNPTIHDQQFMSTTLINPMSVYVTHRSHTSALSHSTYLSLYQLPNVHTALHLSTPTAHMKQRSTVHCLSTQSINKPTLRHTPYYALYKNSMFTHSTVQYAIL